MCYSSANTSHAHCRCYSVLQHLMRHPISEMFNLPVDEKLAPGYYGRYITILLLNNN